MYNIRQVYKECHGQDSISEQLSQPALTKLGVGVGVWDAENRTGFLTATSVDMTGYV